MKKISVKVIANAKKERVVVEKDIYKIYVCAPAVEGKANKAVISALAQYFGINKSRVKIIKGEKSRQKIIEINEK